MSLFSCPACLRRAVHNLIQDPPISSIPLPSTLPRTHQSVQTAPPNRTCKRHHATYDSLVRGHHRRALRNTLSRNTGPNPNNRRKGAGSLTRSEIKDALARENNRARLLNSDASGTNTALTPAEQRQQIRLKKDVEQYYADPLQLANAVTAKLRIPDYAGALALVRASEGIVAKNVVSWNHCIDWCMSQGETDRAWKLYNELKKRGHKPDAHTYTIMLRGLSRNAEAGGSAERAVGIYNSMFSPNSGIVPNTIHTNAVLNVCARMRDMTSLWAIAGQLPERGSGAPDRLTFTVILNAIREDAVARVAALWKNSGKNKAEYDETTGEKLEWEDLEARQKVIFDEALMDGRKLWADVSFRWRRADLVIDEKLVCTMGRLILGCGLRKDFGEVFDLVDSTMNIKLAERGHKKGWALEGQESEDFQKDDCDAENAKSEITLVEYKTPELPLGEKQVYATPGNETLSLILGAAIGDKQMKMGRAYWHYLTTQGGPYKIAADADNIISYLHLLRISRSSKDALDILSREWPAPVAEKLYRRATFVIAMSTCIRDKNNPKVFEVADRLLVLMQDKLEEAKMGMYDKIEASEHDPSLTYKERKTATKARLAKIDDVTFGEDEALSELQRTKSGVESSIVDPKALRMYVDLAILKTSGWNEGVKGRDDANETFERDRKRNNTLRAIRRVSADMVNLGRLAKMKLQEAEIMARSGAAATKNSYSRAGQKKNADRAGTRVAEKLEDMIDLLKTMTRAYDKVINLNERFEDQGRPQLDKSMIDDFRDNKRKISGFLSRTKEEVEKITRGDMKYAKWRNMPKKEEADETEDLDANEDDVEHEQTSRKSEVPKLAKEIQRIYTDTDRELGRFEHHSRRQRFERKQAVEKRMVRRLGTGQDPGVLDDDLSIRRKEEVEARMKQRAFNINVNNNSNSNSNAGGDDGQDTRPFQPFRKSTPGFAARL